MMDHRRSVVLLLVAFTTPSVYGELKGSVGVTSNYLWRGETQTNDGPAVFGGIDYLHPAGLYVGTWSSTVDPHRADDYSPTSDDYDSGLVNQDYEWDLYAGYRHRVKAMELDMGYFAYLYPRGDRYNASTNSLQAGTANQQGFSEFYLGIGFSNISAKYWYTDDYRGSGYYHYYFETNVDFPLRNALSLRLHGGIKKGIPIDDGEHRASDYHVAIAKGPFRFMVSQMSDNEDGHQSDNPRISITWQHEIDL